MDSLEPFTVSQYFWRWLQGTPDCVCVCKYTCIYKYVYHIHMYIVELYTYIYIYSCIVVFSVFSLLGGGEGGVARRVGGGL